MAYGYEGGSSSPSAAPVLLFCKKNWELYRNESSATITNPHTHNTLHAFQHLPFETAVLEASKVFGTAAYMSEEQFRKELQRGRIQEEDIKAVLATEPEAEIWPGKLTRSALRLCLMLTPRRLLTAQNLGWAIEEDGVSDRGAEPDQDNSYPSLRVLSCRYFLA